MEGRILEGEELVLGRVGECEEIQAERKIYEIATPFGLAMTFYFMRLY